MLLAFFYIFAQLAHNASHIFLLGGDHIYSSWDIDRAAPALGCYTEALYDALLKRWSGAQETVVVLGLGGGILPARLARDDIRTRVFEIDFTVMETYHATFAPRVKAWSPSVTTHVTLYLQDALTASYEGVAWVIVDIPLCYRDVSRDCFLLLHRIVKAGSRVVVNVWDMYVSEFLVGAPPGHFSEIRQGVRAYVI